MRRFVFAVIMFLIAIGIVACGRTEQSIEVSMAEGYSMIKNIEL